MRPKIIKIFSFIINDPSGWYLSTHSKKSPVWMPWLQMSVCSNNKFPQLFFKLLCASYSLIWLMIHASPIPSRFVVKNPKKQQYKNSIQFGQWFFCFPMTNVIWEMFELGYNRRFSWKFQYCRSRCMYNFCTRDSFIMSLDQWMK